MTSSSLLGRPASPLLRKLLFAAILLASYTLALSSMVQKSPTFDEQGFIVRGLAYVRAEEDGGTRGIRVGHPPILNALNALLLAGDPTVRLPVDDPSWQESSFHRPAELFLWEIGNDVEHIMFLARLPTIWLGLFLVAIGARWAADLRRMRAGGAARRAWGPVTLAALLTAVLLAFDPNLLASMRLATTDLGLAAAATLAGYTLWRWLRTPDWTRALVAGGALGLLQNTKYTAALFVPLFAVVFLIALIIWWRRGRAGGEGTGPQLLGQAVLVYVPASLLVLWATSGFDIGTLPAELPMLSQLVGATIPLANYVEQLLDIGGRLQVSTSAFLLGMYSDSGWWSYFPVAFLVKTPLPVLLLLAGALIRVVILAARRQLDLSGNALIDMAALAIPAAGYFSIALTSEINLGYRHLLPVLPFLYVGIGAVLAPVLSGLRSAACPVTRWVRVRAAAVAGLLFWLVVVSVGIHPHYLTFFNLLAGGPANGWRVLVDSNIDWGQDLGRLATWQAENDVGEIWLSYFGEARPEYYGLDYKGLDSFPPRLMNPAARPFSPAHPAPGWYAISATNLQGVHFADHDQFAYFRERTPVTRIGNSIFIYRVETAGPTVALILSGRHLDEMLPRDLALLGTNDIRPRWVAGEQAFIIPADSDSVWLAEGQENPVAEVLLDAAEATTGPDVAQSQAYSLREVTFGQHYTAEPVATLRRDESAVSLLDYTVLPGSAGEIVVRTVWRQDGQPSPLALFVHALDENATLVAQWDGLGARWEGWQPGDILIQEQHMVVPAGRDVRDLRLITGAYDPRSVTRWQSVEGIDTIDLRMP